MVFLRDGERHMTKELNGLVFTVYTVRGQTKIVHPSRVGQRIGKSVVRDFATEAKTWEYAAEYAA